MTTSPRTPKNDGSYEEHDPSNILGQQLDGFDSYELEKLTLLENQTLQLLGTIKLYRALKHFAHKHKVFVTDIDVAHDFAAYGEFQEKNRDELEKASHGRDYLRMISGSFGSAIHELQVRMNAKDPNLVPLFRAKHPEFES